MLLDEKYSRFLKKRKKLARTWPLIGTILLAVLIGFLIWLYFRSPLIVNPFEIMGRIESGTVEQTTLVLMAVLLPIMFLTCFFLLMALVLFAFAAFSAEKKHIRIIDRLLREKEERGALEE